MQRIILTLMFVVLALSSDASGDRLDSLYRCLDMAIARSEEYVEVREHRIDSIRKLVAEAGTTKERYEREMKVFMEYKPYENDSAVASITRCLRMAEKMADVNGICKCRSLLAFQCSTTGMYAEALSVLAATDTTGVDRESLCSYYIAYCHVYGELAYYTKVDACRQMWWEEAEKYSDVLLMLLDPDTDEWLQRRELKAHSAGDTATAFKISDRRLKMVERGTHAYAIVAFYRYMDCKLAGDMEMSKYWLVESALSDVRNAIMDQGALWELANLLNAEGQLVRSYGYIGFAWQSAEKFSTRMRSWQISPILSVIDKKYSAEVEHNNVMLLWLIALVSVMAVLLFGLLVYVARQRNRLAAAHKELSRKSMQMSALNDELRLANMSLDETNRQLQDTVRLLNEQTRVKEEYIGRFMRLCSRYIDRNDDFRKRVNKMLKNREYETLYQMTKSGEMKDHELDEMYANFDAAFLHLFPNFVDDFNALLNPEERIVVGDGKQLNTTLRIFALIRLGISDSSAIAEFLHYSVNTIYNYRARIKNGALDGRGSFESRVKNIGMTH